MLKADEIKIIPTRDGSNTLFLESLNETYHSRHGALREAMHVYMQNGLAHWVSQNGAKRVKVFELGFGTGMNAWLAREFAMLWGEQVQYMALEKFPVDATILAQVELGFGANWDLWSGFLPVNTEFWGEAMRKQLWLELVEQKYGQEEALNGISSAAEYDHFSIHKIQGDALLFFERSSTGNQGFDVVFWDAFAPKKQPELWTEELFLLVWKAMNPGGVLVTYTANSEVRRRLIRAGFVVEKPQGPPGKREMLRATKPKL